jgi:hypothetical protein
VSDLVERLRKRLGEAKTEISETAHLTLRQGGYSVKVHWKVATPLVNRDRALIADYDAAQHQIRAFIGHAVDDTEAASVVAAHALRAGALMPQIQRAADFWLEANHG